MLIRMADEHDLPVIQAITNQAIEETTAIWSLTPVTLESRRVWLTERLNQGYPVLVAGIAGDIVGFAALSPFRPHEGYIHTAEDSLYVRPEAQGKGVGKALLAALLEQAGSLGIHVVVSGIDAANEVSIKLHTQAGFEKAGLLPQVGRKFDRWLDLLFMQKIVGLRLS